MTPTFLVVIGPGFLNRQPGSSGNHLSRWSLSVSVAHLHFRFKVSGFGMV